MKKIDTVFVFGSNLAGRHGKGAALVARNEWGAAYGLGTGFTGDAYAIPTKDENLEALSLDKIQEYVNEFLKVVKLHPTIIFYVTAFGTGLAGYSVTQIKELFGDFSKLPYNIVFTKDWIA